MKKVILASSSPRRKEMLNALGIANEAIPADIDETPRKGETTKVMVKRLSYEKAKKIAEQNPKRLVIASDTALDFKGKILGKPRNKKHAKEILQLLQGKKHLIYTGICLMQGDKSLTAVEETKVYFRPMTKKEIDWYVGTGEPMDKAGAYGIQAYGGLFVKKIEGSYSAVRGLPIEKLVDLLKKFGVWQQIMEP
ncbi:MAG: Maf family protein [Patescibacteria group bacterium]